MDDEFRTYWARFAPERIEERVMPWWKYHPHTLEIAGRRPGPDDAPDPRFPVGALVRLKDRPEQARRVLRIEWHYFCSDFVYVVETSAPANFAPYWFAGQLEPVEGNDEHEG